MEEVTRRVVRCPRCGTPLEPDWNLCPHCGWVVRPGVQGDEDATIPQGKHFARSAGSERVKEAWLDEEPNPSEREDAREGSIAHEDAPGQGLAQDGPSEEAAAAADGEATAEAPAERAGSAGETRVDCENPGENPTRLVDRSTASPGSAPTRVIPHSSERDVTRRMNDDGSTARGTLEGTRYRPFVPTEGEMEGQAVAGRGAASALGSPEEMSTHDATSQTDTARRPVQGARAHSHAAEGLRWRARMWLRRGIDWLVGSDIDGPEHEEPYTSKPPRPPRRPRWPERLGMPKFAALVGGIVCAVLVWMPWLSATAVQGLGGLASLSTLNPQGIVVNCWDILSAVFGGSTSSSRVVNELMNEVVGGLGLGVSSTASALPAFVLLALGLSRIVTLALLVFGVVFALIGDSPFRFSMLQHGIRWTFWSAGAWIVLLPRLGWGSTTSSSAVSGRSFAIDGLVLGYVDAHFAWVALLASLVTLLVIRAWRRSHAAYPW